jgi:hypothetical protein
VGKERERERERERDELENFLGFRGYVPPVVPNNLSNGVPNFVLPCYFENFSFYASPCVPYVVLIVLMCEWQAHSF